MKRFGFSRQGHQRHRCKQCGKTFSDIPERPLDDLRVPQEKGQMIAHMLCEGIGIRAIARLADVHQQTVLNVLELAGQKCKALLDRKLVNLAVGHVELDEIWCFVGRGDQYTFLAMDQQSKLLLHHHIAKRNKEAATDFLEGLKRRLREERFDLTTDNFGPYRGYLGSVFNVFGQNVNHGTETKFFARQNIDGPRRYSPVVCKWVKRRVEIGEREMDSITINHMERTNLSVRLFNRRFTRLTLGYSKKLKNLKHQVALFVAHWNFCRVHSAHGHTPAQAHGVTDHAWTIEELLTQ